MAVDYRPPSCRARGCELEYRPDTKEECWVVTHVGSEARFDLPWVELGRPLRAPHLGGPPFLMWTMRMEWWAERVHAFEDRPMVRREG